MAKRRIPQPKRKLAPEPVTTREQAYGEARTIAADLNGLRCVGEFLNSSHYGSTCMSIPEETKEWLRAILFPWIRETAARVEGETNRVAAFLREAPKAEVA